MVSTIVGIFSQHIIWYNKWKNEMSWITSITFYEIDFLLFITAVNCTEPPEKPESGTWEWDGGIEFENSVAYTCGPYGNFLMEDGSKVEEIISGLIFEAFVTAQDWRIKIPCFNQNSWVHIRDSCII